MTTATTSKANEPTEWTKEWTRGVSGVHPTYPTDGRETVYEPFERVAPTDTVRAYLKAALRASRGDKGLPAGFQDYLTQRVPTAVHFGSQSVPLECGIDRCGRVTPPVTDADPDTVGFTQ